MVLGDSLPEWAFSLAYVCRRAVLTFNVVYGPGLVDGFYFVLWRNQHTADGVRTFGVYRHTRFPNSPAYGLRHPSNARDRNVTLHLPLFSPSRPLMVLLATR